MNTEALAWALFEAHRNSVAKLSPKAGSFVGQIAVDPEQPLSEKQQRWFEKLLDRAGLSASTDGGEA